jgi:iron complex transport system ATP-binding protein
MRKLLTITDLAVGYRRPILSQLSLECGQGLFVSILGSNGVGKTTLLRTISRHLKPLEGQVILCGKPLAAIRAGDLAKIMSVVLTDKAAPPLLRVLEYAALGRHPHSGFLGKLGDNDLKVVEEALQAVRAEHLAERFVEELSDGERQKVVLARALAQEPGLMLLDEPTAHLDLKHSMEVMGILRGLCRHRGLTVLAALHDVDVAAKVSDLVITLKDGKLLAFGRPEDVLSPESVSELYDLDQVGFSTHLGAIEIRGDGRSGHAMVISERDTGTLAFRLLAKRGYTFSAGFFPDSDLDAHVASALGARLYSWKTCEKPDHESLLQKALADLDNSLFVVNTLKNGSEAGEGPPIGRLLEEAGRRGLQVLSLDQNGDPGSLLAALDLIEERAKREAA